MSTRPKIDLAVYERRADEAQKLLEEKKKELADRIGYDLMTQESFHSWKDYVDWKSRLPKRGNQ